VVCCVTAVLWCFTDIVLLQCILPKIVRQMLLVDLHLSHLPAAQTAVKHVQPWMARLVYLSSTLLFYVINFSA